MTTQPKTPDLIERPWLYSPQRVAAELRRLQAENAALKQQIAPAGWREVMEEMADDLENRINTQGGLPRRIERDLKVVKRARALLAAAPEAEGTICKDCMGTGSQHPDQYSCSTCNGSGLHPAPESAADARALSDALRTAIARIEDMLKGDDGQAFKEAEKALPRLRAALGQPVTP